MSNALQLVSSLLEDNADDVNPKLELLRVIPDVEHWLKYNGFERGTDPYWLVKAVGTKFFSVRPPNRMSPVYTLSISDEQPYYDLDETTLKLILIQRGAATQ